MDDAELKLVIAACRANFDKKSSASVEPSVPGIDWDRFLALANRHRVQALCWHGLRPIHEGIPPAVALQLRSEADAITGSNLRMAAESKRLLEIFLDRHVPLLFLKGLSLGALAYGDPFRKMGWDIDLLVEPMRLDEALSLLRDAGYEPIIPASDNAALKHWHSRRKESVWRHPGGFHLDLHTRLADNPALLPGVGMGSPAQAVDIAPGISLPTLADEELFAYLCVHGASSAWFRLKWITDFSALLHTKEAAKVERLYQRSQDFGAGRSAGQALLLADRLFAIELGDDLRKALRSDRVNPLLASIAEREISKPAEPTATFLGTAAIHLSQLGLRPGWRFKLSEAARQLRDIADRSL